MSDKLFQLQAELIKALAHPTRIRLIEHMRGTERCVCRFTEDLGLEQSNVSQHLAILRKQDIVSSRKEGMNVIYWVRDERIFQLLDLGLEILKSQVAQTADLIDRPRS